MWRAKYLTWGIRVDDDPKRTSAKRKSSIPFIDPFSDVVEKIPCTVGILSRRFFARCARSEAVICTFNDYQIFVLTTCHIELALIVKNEKMCSHRGE